MAQLTCGHCAATFGAPRRRTYCYTCQPAHGSVSIQEYGRIAVRLNEHKRTGVHAQCCGIAKRKPVEPVAPKPYPTCACGVTLTSRSARYCSALCRKLHARRANRSNRKRSFEFSRWAPPSQTPLSSRILTEGRGGLENGHAKSLKCLTSGCSDAPYALGQCKRCHKRDYDKRRRAGIARQVTCPCGEVFTASRSLTKWCSPECRPPKGGSGLELECLQCGVLFRRRNGGQVVCSSDLCRALNKADANRRHNLRRRGAPLGQPYTLGELAERDKNRCHLCKKSVDLRLSGLDPSGPTVDHILPISAGGVDSFENVALAHRLCNITRGAGGIVQLRLVA